MSRRHQAEKREVLPDPRYNDVVLTKFMNNLMLDGKKSAAEGIVYSALENLAEKAKNDNVVTDDEGDTDSSGTGGHGGLKLFHRALKKVAPQLEVRSRRVGGATYQVPMEVRFERGRALAMRWLIGAARKRSERTMAERLTNEIFEASQERGNAIKKRDDTHKMAEANKAFAHFRW